MRQVKCTYFERIVPLVSKKPIPVACTCLLWAVALVAAPLGQADPLEVTWNQRIEVASGQAYRGPWRMNESEFHYVDDPTVAINEQGAVGVAWADQSRQDIFFQIYDLSGTKRFEESINVSRSPEIFSWLPRMVVTSDQLYILWQEIIFSGGSHGGEIFFARSTDRGKTFTEPINLSNTIAGDGKGRLTQNYWHNGSLDLAMGPGGDLYAAWTEYEGALWFSRSMNGGESFSQPLHIAGDNTIPARGPALAVDDDEGVYLTWTVGEDRAADIHFTQSDDGGRSFGEPQIVYASDGHADAPKIAVDSQKTIHLVYGKSPTGPLQRYQIRYTQSHDGGQTFQEPREIASPGEQFQSVNFPSLSLDGQDNLYLIWELFPHHQGGPQGLGLTYSSDGGQTFATPSVVPGSIDPALGFNGSQQGLLMDKLAVNETGAMAVVNSTFKKNQTSHIWLFRGQASGR